MHTDTNRPSALLKAMAHKDRLKLLCLLLSGEKSVRELRELSGLGQSMVSQHLARLRLDGVVVGRRDAQKVYYSVLDPLSGQLLETLKGIYCTSSDRDVKH